MSMRKGPGPEDVPLLMCVPLSYIPPFSPLHYPGFILDWSIEEIRAKPGHPRSSRSPWRRDAVFQWLCLVSLRNTVLWQIFQKATSVLCSLRAWPSEGSRGQYSWLWIPRPGPGALNVAWSPGLFFAQDRRRQPLFPNSSVINELFVNI